MSESSSFISAKDVPFDVLFHSSDVLVIQTNAGVVLDNVDSLDNSDTDLDNMGSVEGSFGQFNLGMHVADDPSKVLANRGRLLSLINQYLCSHHQTMNNTKHESFKPCQVQRIYWLNQVHGNQVIKVSDNDISSSELSDSNISKADTSNKSQASKLPLSFNLQLQPPSADAMFTDMPNTALAIMTADCVPIVLFDKYSGQVAAIHAGWQGLANGIIGQTVAKLTDDDLSRPNNTQTSNQNISHKDQQCVRAWIGACISQRCYEVSQDVVTRVLLGCQDMGMDIQAVRTAVVCEHTDPNKAWLDLPKLAVFQLKQHGVTISSPAHHQSKHAGLTVQDATLDATLGNDLAQQCLSHACSYSDRRYYSYRRMTHKQQTSTGRMALLGIKLA